MRLRPPSLASIRGFAFRHRWRFGAAFGIWLAWLLFGWLALPALVKPRLERAVSEATGHPTTLGAFEFDPLFLAVTLRELRIATPAGETVISTKRVFVDFETRSLIDWAWNFKTLEIEEPFVNAVLRADGSLNLADLAGPPAATPPPAATGPATLPRLVIQEFAFRGGRIDAQDLGVSPPMSTSFSNLALSLQDFSTLADARGEYALQARGETGGLFVWRGSVGVNPLASDGRFTLEGFHLPTAFDLVEQRFGFDLTDGMLRATIDYSLRDAAVGVALEVTDAAIAVERLALGPRAGAPQLTLPLFEVTGVKIDLNARSARVGEVKLAGLGVTATRDAAGIDLLRLLTAAPSAAPAADTASAPTAAPIPTPAPGPAAAPATASPWRIALDRVALEQADLALTDATLPAPGTLRLAPVDLALTEVRLGVETRFTVGLVATINGAGKLSVQGPLIGADPAGTLAVKLEALALAPFQPWIDPIARVTLGGGALSVDGRFLLQPGKVPAQRFTGYAEIAGLKVGDQRIRQDLLRWNRLQLRGLDFALAPQRLRIDEIVAEQPYLRFIVGADGRTNLQDLMVATAPPAAAAPPSAPPATASAVPKAAPLPVEIKRVRVLGGSANFADLSLEPDFATGIQELDGSITGLSSQEAKRAAITLDGKVDRYAPVRIRGQLNLLAAESFSDVTMSFRDIELTTFTPYSGKFAGYKIDKGRLSLDIRYQLADRFIKGDHRIVLDQLTLGERVDSADAMSLPIKLALALLKDSRGVIDLELPVEGNLDDPQFKYGPIVWKAVMSVFTKIVTAPFAALGALFGGGDDLSQLGFAAGSAALDPAATARLDTLAKGLAERPALRLDVRGVAAPGADGELLARRAVLAELRPDRSATELIALTPKEQKALLALHQQRLGAAPTVAGLAADAVPTPAQLQEAALAALAAAQPATPEALRALAQARAAAVKDYLATRAMVPAERVFLLEVDTAVGAARGDAVVMTLALSAD